MTLNIAHRGFSGQYPENTMIAFEQALAAQADGVETDVHLTRDGVIVICHDEDIRRTSNGIGAIAGQTYEELLRWDFGAWKGQSGQRIPTLDALLGLIKDSGKLVNLELKNNLFRYEGMEQMILDKLARLDMLEQVIFSSFNHASMGLVAQLCPEAETALLYGNRVADPVALARQYGVKGLHPAFETIDQAMVDRCHEAGLAVRPWTVNPPEIMQEMLALGVDAIITNEPAALHRLMD
ncbi:MAG: glycerophosphodiester phosphodiesterase [Christensenellales bacterium]|jgi:glycerophosphoryl diester phosphodiesterase